MCVVTDCEGAVIQDDWFAMIEDVADDELPPGVATGEATCHVHWSVRDELWGVSVLCMCIVRLSSNNRRVKQAFSNRRRSAADFSHVVEETETNVAAAKIRKMVEVPGPFTSGYADLVKDCLAAGHFKVGQPGHSTRTPAGQKRQRKVLLSADATGLEEDMTQVPVLAAIQAVLHVEKYRTPSR